jgi:DnaJ-class molecular chaperone
VLRVKGRGVVASKGTGDLLAEVQVAVPTHLDEKAKEALERFHELEPKENPRADLMARRGSVPATRQRCHRDRTVRPRGILPR